MLRLVGSKESSKIWLAQTDQTWSQPILAAGTGFTQPNQHILSRSKDAASSYTESLTGWSDGCIYVKLPMSKYEPMHMHKFDMNEYIHYDFTFTH